MRVIVFDRTCLWRGRAMSHAWRAGARLYRARGWIDDAHGVASWAEALAWIAASPRPVAELQYWGHGTWGGAWIDRELLDAGALVSSSPLCAPLAAATARLAPDALIWFRTCETLGAERGIAFAERLAAHTGARVAGHTFVIGAHQSGLHGVAPGARADWSPDEGLARGTPAAPERGRWSTPWAPRTITCLDRAMPDAWLAR